MTRLVNDPMTFAADSLASFARAHPEAVLLVDGGVVRAEQTERSRVAIVSGGGSGHYPAFAGWIGDGLLDGAACGAVFSSPSQKQVSTVARTANNGAGILFVPINYAGDILHFSGSAEELRGAGIDVRMVAVTDDIASGPSTDAQQRRGIAGSFIVIKVLGAAAATGATLDALETMAQKANNATRSFGVAFGGCTLPGSDHPMFEIASGRMAVGLGIHGEPGIGEAPLGTADEVADVIVDGLFAEREPIQGQRLAVLVNGLGTTKYDELDLVFARVLSRIGGAGMIAVAPVVGELVTSLDMAGLSVSFSYLDDELERFWLAPASAPAFARTVHDGALARRKPWRPDVAVAIREGAEPSRYAAGVLSGAAERALAALVAQETALGELDAIAGDGDHGVGMVRGAGAAFDAVRTAVQKGAGVATALRLAGENWSAVSGGTSGALWGTGLVAAAASLSDDAAPTDVEIVDAVAAYAAAITERGGASVGDKTMLDAMVPFVSELRDRVSGGAELADAWKSAVTAGDAAVEQSAMIASRRGRSRIHGEHSVGHADPGAASFAIVVRAVSSSSH